MLTYRIRLVNPAERTVLQQRHATVKDILGHVGEDITSERYSEGSLMADMFEAIAQLPRLPVRGKEPK